MVVQKVHSHPRHSPNLESKATIMDSADLRRRLEVISEQRRIALRDNFEDLLTYSKQERAGNKFQRNLEVYERELKDLDAKDAGVDVERIKNLQYNIQEHEDWMSHLERSPQSKGSELDYNSKAWAVYEKQMNSLKSRAGTEPSGSSLSSFMSKRDKERAKFSKRRRFDEEQDITFINQRNYKFNLKLSRAYDKFTLPLRQKLEGVEFNDDKVN